MNIRNHNGTLLFASRESSSTLLHRLHSNERQLRTLVVVLSLTGGFALSFALGVGIMICWYLHKCKRKKRFSEEEEEEGVYRDKQSCATNCCSECLQAENEQVATTTTTYQHEESTDSHSSNSLFIIPPLPLSAIINNNTPEPSAPSAKEIHNHVNSNNNVNTNDDIGHPSTSNQDHIFCHECLLPPPAYTEI